MDPQAVATLIAGARQHLRQRAPFFDFLLDQVALHATEAVPTACVHYAQSRFVLAYNPYYLARLPRDQQAAVLHHELLHLANRHWERRGEREPGRWNVACDYAINSYLPDMPADALHPPDHLRGRSAEDIYARLADVGELAPSDCLVLSPEVSEEDLERAYRRLLGAAAQRFGADQVATEVGHGMADAMPGTQMAELTPQGGLGLNWPALLTRYGRPLVRRRTLLRPNRRGLSQWGTQRDRRLRVVVVVDTSGSISAALAAAFLAELRRLRASCASLTVILADAAVQAVFPYEALGEQPFVGRGGTDYAPALAHINAHLAHVDLGVYLTDGEGALPSLCPVVPLLWVVTNNRTFPGRPAMFVSRMPE